MSRIELKDVTFTYGSGTPYEIKALDGINIAFESGIVTGLIGHTGSGKSTLVQLLNGLLKPKSGEILLDGENIWSDPKKIRDVRFKVGLVMQYPEYQLFAETVRADIAFGPRNMGMKDDEIEMAVRKAAEFTGLSDDLLDKSPFDLSGGQKRRAALAGIIAMQPKVLVLDEPAAGLDPGGRREILNRIRDFCEKSGHYGYYRQSQHGGYGDVLRQSCGDGKRKSWLFRGPARRFFEVRGAVRTGA